LVLARFGLVGREPGLSQLGDLPHNPPPTAGRASFSAAEGHWTRGATGTTNWCSQTCACSAPSMITLSSPCWTSSISTSTGPAMSSTRSGVYSQRAVVGMGGRFGSWTAPGMAEIGHVRDPGWKP